MARTIALLGAGGKMGFRIARKLQQAGYDLRAVEVAEAGKARLAEAGLVAMEAAEGLKGAAKDQMKNFVKGEDVIFKGWKQGFTDQIVDTGTSLGAPKYTSFVVSATQAVGDAVKKVAAQYD